MFKHSESDANTKLASIFYGSNYLDVQSLLQWNLYINTFEVKTVYGTSFNENTLYGHNAVCNREIPLYSNLITTFGPINLMY